MKEHHHEILTCRYLPPQGDPVQTSSRILVTGMFFLQIFPKLAAVIMIKSLALIEFSRNYTKLAMLSFLYYFIVKGKLI